MMSLQKLIEKNLAARDPDLPKVSGGLWIRARIDDKQIWQWIIEEKVTGFSWSGNPIKDTLVRKPTGSYYILEKADIIDISVVTWPADLNAQIKIADKEKQIIEGFVSTSKQNRRYEFILPTVFEFGMQQYMNLPPKGTIFFNHKSDKPVGKILEWKVVKKKMPEKQKQYPLDMPPRESLVQSVFKQLLAQKGKNGKPEGDGGSDYCYCPTKGCGYKEKHDRGKGQGKAQPCIERTCPKCGAKLIGEKELKRRQKVKKHKK